MNPWKPLVLVVDDETNVRRILCHHLQTANYETIEAKNGRDALEMVSTFKPDLILLDVMMPLIDGFKVCQYVKGDPQTRHIGIVILTAKGSKDDVVSALKAGADDYVVKPFTKETIVERVTKVMTARPPMPRPMDSNGSERRQLTRTSRPATISWSWKDGGKMEVTYKEQVLDISLRGLSFEHVRCEVCTGYEKDSVHAQCPFAKNAKRFSESSPLSLVVTLPNRKILHVEGKIAYVFQPPDAPRTEKVGVTFTSLSQETIRTIKEYLTQTN